MVNQHRREHRGQCQQPEPERHAAGGVRHGQRGQTQHGPGGGRDAAVARRRVAGDVERA
jgi:hypothetical protein